MYQSTVSSSPTVAVNITLPVEHLDASVAIGADGLLKTFTVIGVALVVHPVNGSFAVKVYNVVSVGLTVIVEFAAK